jgi:hypothetical protein
MLSVYSPENKLYDRRALLDLGLDSEVIAYLLARADHCGPTSPYEDSLEQQLGGWQGDQS